MTATIQHHAAPADGDTTEDELRCALRGESVGWVEVLTENRYGEQVEGYHWTPFTAIQLDTEDEPTRLCDDCWTWLEDVAPEIDAWILRGRTDG